MEAKRLRREIRDLEEALRAHGLDPSSVGPAIGRSASAVDDYEPPHFVNRAQRQQATAEFFRRVGGDR